MPNTVQIPLVKAFMKCWTPYLIKAIVVLGLFYLGIQIAPTLEPVPFVLFWIALSSIGAVGIAYRAIVRKTLKRYKFQEGEMFYRRNEGRWIAVVGGFFLSAASMATLILEAPKWDGFEWGLVAAAVIAYVVIYVCIEKKYGKQYTPLFRTASVINWSRGIITGLLVLVYIGLSAVFPQETCNSVEEAFSEAWQPYSSSPTAIIIETEKLTGFVNGLTVYALSEAQTFSFVSYLIIRGILICSSFYAVANLLSFCSLELSEMKRIVVPLCTEENVSSNIPIQKYYVMVAAVGPALLLVAFLIGNHCTAQAINSDGLTWVDKFVEEKKEVAIYVVDGHYKEDQLQIGVINESRRVSDAVRNVSEDKEQNFD